MTGVLRWSEEHLRQHQAKRAAECAKDDEYIDDFGGLGTLRVAARPPLGTGDNVNGITLHGVGAVTPYNKIPADIGDNVSEVIEYGTPILTHRPRQFLLTLPYPPTLNHNTLPAIGGGRILTQEHRNFRALVAQIVFAANIKRLDGKLSVTINVYPPDARTRDLSNLIKPIEDALQRAGAILNDANIDELIVRRVTTSERPRMAQVVVTVREIA